MSNKPGRKHCALSRQWAADDWPDQFANRSALKLKNQQISYSK
jgi:hypothetical protein